MTVRHPKHKEIQASLRAGGSDKRIALQVGADRGTVARYRRQLKLPGYRTSADSPACRHGHPFPENRGFNGKGHLICLECQRVRSGAGWVDEIAIVRAVAGDPPARLTPRERRAAISQLAGWGNSARQIADRVGCSERTVWRALALRPTPHRLAPAA